jgi:Calcineurin-like phosphoesterase
VNETTSQSTSHSSVDTHGITLLHLSDLHISEESIQDQRVVLNALFADIERMASTEGGIDLILLTGDLIAKGQYSKESIRLFNAEFLEPLLKTTGVGVDRIFACPGNHDLQLSKIQSLYRQLLDSLVETSAVNSMLDDLPGYPFVYSGFVGFKDLTKDFGRKNLRVETDHPGTRPSSTAPAFEGRQRCVNRSQARRCSKSAQSHVSLLIKASVR